MCSWRLDELIAAGNPTLGDKNSVEPWWLSGLFTGWEPISKICWISGISGEIIIPSERGTHGYPHEGRFHICSLWVSNMANPRTRIIVQNGGFSSTPSLITGEEECKWYPPVNNSNITTSPILSHGLVIYWFCFLHPTTIHLHNLPKDATNKVRLDIHLQDYPSPVGPELLPQKKSSSSIPPWNILMAG